MGKIKENSERIGENALVYINIEELYPHPDNPRRDLGDLKELTDSIKAQGVMQNLTVLRGHYLNDEEYAAALAQYEKDPTIERGEIVDKRRSEDGYTVLIGHRRTAAAKLAGLERLPCVIVEMSPQEQVATMLAENMQRSDLTVVEQAAGMQMMLDLGESVASVADKTGFSQSTVRRRVKLMELDRDKLNAVASRQISLEDLDKLNKIEDIAERNKLLDSIGTNNFNQRYSIAISEQKEREKRNVLLEKIKEVGFDIQPKPSEGDFAYFGFVTYIESILKLDKSKPLFWTRAYNGGVYIYQREADVEKTTTGQPVWQKSQAEIEREQRRAALKEASERATELRADFVRNFTKTAAKKHIDDITVALCCLAAQEGFGWIDEDDYREALGCDPEESVVEYIQLNRELALFHIACMAFDVVGNGDYYAWDATHNECEELDAAYEFICSLGYQMSDEEKALQDGSSELFVKAKEDT